MPVPSPMDLTEAHRYQSLFITRLHWGAPDHQPVTVAGDDGLRHTVTNVSSYAGIRVWVCPERPGAKVEAQIDRTLAKFSTDRIVIFHDDEEQVWRWPVRRQVGHSVTSRLTSHRHRSGQQNLKFAARLDTITLPTNKLLDANTVVAKVRVAFDVETQNETRQASRLMARMYAAMERAYPPATPPAARDHDISLTLARLLFLMFGDDTEMWTPDAFRDFVHLRTSSDGSDLSAQLDLLFTHLDTAERTAEPDSPVGFKYVNGGIFAEHIEMPPLDKEFRNVVLEACAVDWSTISPAIFGSMFQSVRDADTRRKLGEHYTSETNILKTLNPLFLDDLRSELNNALSRETETKQVNALNALWKRLGEVRFLDPACGCGNFIIVAYRELRDIELQVMEGLLDRQKGSDQLTLGGGLVKALRVTLDHFYGIEIDEWPARIAETAMYLTDRQCDLKLRDRFGEAPERLPITSQANILVTDALLIEWASLCPPSENVFIAGNPPFIGARLKTPAQAASLQIAWGKDYNGDLDLVTGWYAKAMAYYGKLDGHAAFVSTNSICQGKGAAVLFGPVHRAGWKIKFAYRTFSWTSEAAGKAIVDCVIVGLARRATSAVLFDTDQHTQAIRRREVGEINAYLVAAPWLIIDTRRRPISPALATCDFGSMPNDKRALTVEIEDLDQARADPIASKYLRRFMGSEDVVQGTERWCLWLVDASESDLRDSPILRARVARVREARLQSKRAATRRLAATAQLFGEIRQPITRYLAIPAHVSEHRSFFLSARFEPDVIASNAVFTTPDPDGFEFAMVSSTMFITWQRTVGGALESRLRFSNTIVWNNFPVPELSAETREEITTAGLEVSAARSQEPGKSLADLYAPGQIPSRLLEAHRALDHLVDMIFGLKGGVIESQRQEALFAQYLLLAQA